jgi:hypothetical protein
MWYKFCQGIHVDKTQSGGLVITVDPGSVSEFLGKTPDVAKLIGPENSEDISADKALPTATMPQVTMPSL